MEFLTKLFCRYWAKEAEDALIFEILQKVKKYGSYLNKIEIYGNRDSCFQCQAKLQWLTTYLNLYILDYAQEEFQTTYLVNPDKDVVSCKLATRQETDIDNIVKFELSPGDRFPIRAFTPASMKMMKGQYTGIIRSIDASKNILRVEIIQIAEEYHSKENSSVNTKEELIKLNNRKTVCIGFKGTLEP
ncbi:MAG: hypothetical protein LBL17_03805 [Coxiellaceae bacterium]|nr:hypothetical protein [Coxiellaceae bacterium]